MSDPRATVQTAARELLRLLSAQPALPKLRVAEADGGLACLIQVWDASGPMPIATQPKGGRRAGCRQDIVQAIRDVGLPLTRKQLVKAFRDAKKAHGPGTIAKALADLTSAGELVNPRDKRGYRLSEWPRRPRTPSLF